MKKIELIIAAHKASEVCAALNAIGVSEVATSEVRGGQAKPEHEDRGDTDAHADLAVNKLEIIVTAERAAAVIRTFASAGWRDLLGDGKIVVYELGDLIRVRAPESHENAL